MENKQAMPMTERLDKQDCWSLLPALSVGRSAVWLGDGPDIFRLTVRVVPGSIFRAPVYRRTAENVVDPG